MKEYYNLYLKPKLINIQFRQPTPDQQNAQQTQNRQKLKNLKAGENSLNCGQS